MPALATRLPCRRPELIVRPLGTNGRHVIKDPVSGKYFHLGEQESFLLLRLDGAQDAEAIAKAFKDRFGQPLSEEDLNQFVNLVQQRGLVRDDGSDSTAEGPQGQQSANCVAETPMAGTPRPEATVAPSVTPPRPRARQSILFWRKSLFDPDRFFAWAAPKLWFLWTPAFVVLSAALIGLAAILVWTNWQELLRPFSNGLHAQTVVLAWVVLMITIFCHEFAHGLTCKHFGGEV